VARNARVAAQRRARREGQAAVPEAVEPVDEMTGRELLAALDEELDRLPPHYREPLVLCYLEGLTRDEAARRLGVPAATLKAQLERGRKRLGAALTRRGCIGGVGLLALAATSPAGASPLRLVHAVLAAASGSPPAAVAALAKGVAMSSVVNKWLLAVLLAAGTVALGIGLGSLAPTIAAGVPSLALQACVTCPPLPHKPEAQAKEAAAPDEASGNTPAAPGQTTVAGRVLAPDGKPLKGARLHLLDHPAQVQPARERAASAADGKFQFTFPRSDVRLHQPHNWVSLWESVFVFAVAEGYGPAVEQVRKASAGAELTLRLAEDTVPIKGRIVDLQGQPVPGVTVRVRELRIPEQNLTAWLDAVAKGDEVAATDGLLTRVTSPCLPSFFPAVTTDRQGRFQLAGIGRERIAALTIEGPTIEAGQIAVRTRPGKVIYLADDTPGLTFPCYGAQFDHPAAPTRPVGGVVRDAATGQPLAGVTVAGTACRAITDKAGRYRLLGLPWKGGTVTATPPEGQPYLALAKEVANPTSLGPVTANFDLKRGLLIQGRLTDQATGKPVAGEVAYFACEDNPRRTDASGLPPLLHGTAVREDGSFAIVGLPGRGIVAARAWGDRYLVGVGADTIRGLDKKLGSFPTYPMYCQPGFYHRLTEINPADVTRLLTCNLTVDPGRIVTGELHGPDGKPLVGALAFGLRFNDHGPYWEFAPQETAAFTVHGIRKGERRKVVFLHWEKHWAGSLTVTGEEKGPVSVKLQPWGVVSGRLVDAKGLPRAGVQLGFPYGAWTGADEGTHPEVFRTDPEGRFRVEGLVPGLRYHLKALEDGSPETDYLFRNLPLKPGESRDLGDVRVTQKP
jgi:hypothetical protein